MGSRLRQKVMHLSLPRTSAPSKVPQDRGVETGIAPPGTSRDQPHGPNASSNAQSMDFVIQPNTNDGPQVGSSAQALKIMVAPPAQQAASQRGRRGGDRSNQTAAFSPFELDLFAESLLHEAALFDGVISLQIGAAPLPQEGSGGSSSREAQRRARDCSCRSAADAPDHAKEMKLRVLPGARLDAAAAFTGFAPDQTDAPFSQFSREGPGRQVP